MNGITWGVAIVGIVIVVGILNSVGRSSRRRSRRRSRSPVKKQSLNARPSIKAGTGRRRDEVILHCHLKDLNWAEFERLLYLYFTDKGYKVIETGVGGNDGGVDLILIDKRTNERTAVQAKHWAHGPVGPNIIRELHSARMNMKPACLYGMLVTSNDVTPQAREEAQARHMTFWHGGVLEAKLESWGKWKPNKRAVRTLTKTRATSVRKQQGLGQKCVCGASMVERKNRSGKPFWGCSTYPKCKHTVDISV